MKLFKKILTALLFGSLAFAQNVSLNDTVHLVYGALTYQGQTIFVTEHGLVVSPQNGYGNTRRNSTNEEFSRYYKMIYGKDAENPNYVIDGENMGFIPFVNINDLYGNNRQVINGVTVSDLAKAFTDKNFHGKEKIIGEVQSFLKRKNK